MRHLTAIDIALLQSEEAEHQQRCPSCHFVVAAEGHRRSPACPHDQALCERGFVSREDREAARNALLASAADTIPPPTGS